MKWLPIAKIEQEPLPCPVCGVDRCAYCHQCSRREGEGVLHEDCTCGEHQEDES